MRILTREEFCRYVEGHVDISSLRTPVNTYRMSELDVESIMANHLDGYKEEGTIVQFKIEDEIVGVPFENIRGLRWHYLEELRELEDGYFWVPISKLCIPAGL